MKGYQPPPLGREVREAPGISPEQLTDVHCRARREDRTLHKAHQPRIWQESVQATLIDPSLSENEAAVAGDEAGLEQAIPEW
jgi:hypothetical protein